MAGVGNVILVLSLEATTARSQNPFATLVPGSVGDAVAMTNVLLDSQG